MDIWLFNATTDMSCEGITTLLIMLLLHFILNSTIVYFVEITEQTNARLNKTGSIQLTLVTILWIEVIVGHSS